MKLTNVKEQIHHAWEMKTPSDPLVLPTDNSAVVLQVAVPPQPCKPHDTFYLIVGEKVAFEHPLKLLMDQYRPELKLPESVVSKMETIAELHLQIEQQFSVILDAILTKNKVERETFIELREVYNAMNWLKTEPQSRAVAAVGLLLARAILIEPRKSVRVSCKKGSEVTVYLGGLLSRSVQ